MMLSVVILTKNEENNIIDCLESVLFVDEIIIIDDFSSDRTVEVIKGFKADRIVIHKRKLDDFSTQRNFGITKAKGDWILFIDADETVPKELRKEILNSLTNDGAGDAFFLKRRDFIWGRELKHGEISTVRLLRLAKKGKGRWIGRVHETWDIKENVGILNNALIHRPHKNLNEFLSEINLYTSIRSEELKILGIKTNGFSIIVFPIGKFLLNYILRLGFLDGVEGFVFAAMMSFHSFLVRGKLWMLQKKQIRSNFDV